MDVPSKWPGKEKALALAAFVHISNAGKSNHAEFAEHYMQLSRRGMKNSYRTLRFVADFTNNVLAFEKEFSDA